MKNIIILPLFLLLLKAGSAQAPPPPPDDDKIDALRIGFFTKYLDLTPEESEKFWPVYNNMRDDLKVLMDNEANLQKKKKIDDMTDAELNDMIKTHFDNEQKILDIKKKYAEEFKKVLPLRKVAKLADAENEFKRQLLQYMKDRPGGGPPPGPGGKGPGGHGPGDGPPPPPEDQ